MSFRYMTLCVGLVLLAGAAGRSQADDWDVQAEDVMAESEATSAQAVEQKKRSVRERADAERLKADSARARSAAETKRREADRALAAAEAEITRLMRDQQRYKKESQAAQQSIKRDQVRMAASQERVLKLKKQNEALRQIRAEQNKKLSDIHTKIGELKVANDRISVQHEENRRAVTRQQAELKAAQIRLQAAEQANSRGKMQLRAFQQKHQKRTPGSAVPPPPESSAMKSSLAVPADNNAIITRPRSK